MNTPLSQDDINYNLSAFNKKNEYTVSKCYTRGESEDQTTKKAHKRDPTWL